LGADVEVTKAGAPIHWFDDQNKMLDADWDEETDWTGFGPFDIAVDRDAQPSRELGIYDYDEDAQQRPWNFKQDDEQTAIRRARAKAATITSLLDITNIVQRNTALRFLTELFEHLRHPSTYRALRNLGSDGLDLETLQAMTELRRVWMQRSESALAAAGPCAAPVASTTPGGIVTRGVLDQPAVKDAPKKR
jgi:hypothetical protein